MTQVIKVGCLLMAIYYTASTICQYFENLDETFIKMKRYNQDPSIDKYPTFSICFKGTDFVWYHDNNIYEAYGLNATQFELMLKGDKAIRYERNFDLGSYRKVAVTANNGSSQYFESFNIKLTDIFSEVKFATDKSSQSSYYSFAIGQNIGQDSMPLHNSYHGADKICFTRTSNDSNNIMRKDDLLTFRSSILGQELFNETEIQIFIHYPDQLLSSFSKPKYTASFPYFLSTLNAKNKSNVNVLELKIAQAKILRKRHDANTPCNKDIRNHDRYLLSEYVNNLGCIPMYWKNLLMNTTVSQPRHDECRSPEKLKKAYEDFNDINSILDLTDKPCDEMLLLSVDSVNDHPNAQLNDVSMKFRYTEKIYEEVLYDKKYSFESFCNTLGGFWGIFLGFSLMQFPDLVEFILQWIAGFKKMLSKGSLLDNYSLY